MNSPDSAALSTLYPEGGMARSKFDGKAIEGLGELVEHHDQQDRSRQLSSDVAERRGSMNPSNEEEKRVP